MFNGKYFDIENFKGGYAGNLPATQIGINQAKDLDNIVIKPGGLGFRSRLGNSKVNSGGALNSGANIQGLGWYLQEDGDKWLVTVAGAKIYESVSAGTTFNDITGSVTVTAGANNTWDLFTFGNDILAFGGSATSPDAPWKWTGSGNAAAIGGTAPSAYGAFSANNRVFAFRTSASPSTIYWSVLGDETDFGGSGSGSATVGSLSDNQKVTAAIVISTNYVLVFKENSTYQMVISSAPFPIYSLFDNVGCAGKHAAVNVDGTVYFITSQGEMLSTNGESIKRYPPLADDLWAAVTSTRLPYVQGFRQTGTDYDWLVWCVTTSGSTNNVSIVWDLLNECWLRCTTGYKMNVATQDNFGNVFTGGYDGFVYKPDQNAVYADASEAAGTITSYWQSGWLNPDNISKIVQVSKFTTVLTPKASGSVTLAYGFDGIVNSSSTTLSQVASSTEQYLQKDARLSGRGNTFEYRLSLASSTIDMEVQKVILAGKVYGQKGQAAD